MALDEDTLKKVSLGAAVLGVSVMVSLIVGISIGLCHLYKYAKFRFILVLILLMVCSDTSLGCLAVCFYLEDQVTQQNLVLIVAICVAIFTFLFNFCNITLHWLFSMKYWMVSREVPRLFEADRHIKFNEQGYKVANTIGIILIIPICLIAAAFRGDLAYKSAGGQTVSDGLIFTVQLLLWIINGLELITTLVLADALRRINNSVKENPFLEANRKVMCLHITMSLMHICSYSATVFFAIRTYKDPGNLDHELESNIARMLLYIFTGAVQGIMIYLIFQFDGN